MNPKRKQRLYLTIFLFVVASATTALLILVSGENMNMFYPPIDVASGKVPADRQIRAGGMVLENSVDRQPDSLAVRFVLTDYQGSFFEVSYVGILPDLFREGQGILVEGKLDAAGTFQAERVLAKHDENSMPPELMDLQQGPGSTASASEFGTPL